MLVGGVFRKTICSPGLQMASHLLPLPLLSSLRPPVPFSFSCFIWEKKKSKSLTTHFTWEERETNKAARGHSRTESWRGWMGSLWDSWSPACVTVGSMGHLTHTPQDCPEEAWNRAILSVPGRAAGQEKDMGIVLQPWGSRSW